MTENREHEERQEPTGIDYGCPAGVLAGHNPDGPDRRVRWHDNGRGPRVVIEIGGEDLVTTTDAARELRDDLTAVLDEIEAARAKGPT